MKVFATRPVAVAVLIALASPHEAWGQTATARARSILREPAYSFCHETQRFIAPADRAYCGYVDVRSACPEFAQSCDAMEHARAGSCATSPTLGSSTYFLQQALAVLFVTLALGALFWAVRAALRARRIDAVVGDASPTTDAPRVALPVPPRSSSELWALALAAHGRGEPAAALYALLGALLRTLDERGAIQIDDARTNGEYVRQCADPDARGPLLAAVREVERVRFGGLEATAGAFERLRPRVEPIVRGVMTVLLCFAVGVGCRAKGGRDGGDGAGETGPGGHRAVRELLTAMGVRTHVLEEAPEDVRDLSRLVVIDGASTSLEPEQWRSLLGWVEGGGRLLVAGGSASWPRALGVTATVRHGEPRGTLEDDVTPPFRVASSAAALTAPTTAEPLATYASDESLYAVRIPQQRGTVSLLASADLITNAGIAVDQNAEATVALIREVAGERDVYFVEDASGAASNPVQALARSGLLPVVLQTLLALALAAVWVGRHFARPHDPIVSQRRAFAEHVRALGLLYARSKNSRAVLDAYARLVMERLRDRFGSGRAQLAEAIAVRTGESPAEVHDFLHALERLNGGERIPWTEQDDLRAVKRLNDWYTRLG